MVHIKTATPETELEPNSQIQVGDTFPRGGGAGFKAKVLEREGPWCLLEITHPEITRKNYEVVKIRFLDARRFSGVFIPSRESLPSSEQWGTNGFTYTNIESARRKLQEILA